jgi:UDP-N-acetylglucosamine diphosphorylase/glucosamine-1-phosphate N-acetyltransferase
MKQLEVYLFEDPNLISRFSPTFLTRPLSSIDLGSKKISDLIERVLGVPVSGIFVREYLAPKCREIFRKWKVNPDSSDLLEHVLLLNGFANPCNLDFLRDKLRSTEETLVVSGNETLAAILTKKRAVALIENSFSASTVSKDVLVLSSKPGAIFCYPWEIITNLPKLLIRAAEEFYGSETQSKRTNQSERPRTYVSPKARVEKNVVLDSRNGPIIIEDDTEIESFSRIEGPAIIGKRTVIKGARVGWSSIGTDCRIGGEIEESIFSSYSNKAHEGFLGHSFIGNWANLGANTTNSNLKNTYGTIKVNVDKVEVDTGQTKLGCFISDNGRTAIGSLIFAGKSIGVASHVFGIVRTDIPSFVIDLSSIGGKCFELELESAIRTQKRMMVRRDVEQTEADRSLLKKIFEITSTERNLAKVSKERIAI